MGWEFGGFRCGFAELLRFSLITCIVPGGIHCMISQE